MGKYKRVMLKLSGEALAGDKHTGFDLATVEAVAKEVKQAVYCTDCKRSIYGEYKNCDVNIENRGKYVLAGDKCGCKVV